MYVFKNNTIKLVSEKYQLFDENPEFVNVKSTSTGSISKINPRIEVQENQNIKFDLSDTSLSFVDKGITYSGI